MAKRGEPFFFYMAIALIAIVISGFSIASFSSPGGPLAVPLFLHFHGAVFLGWFILLAMQAKLAGSGNVALHKRLGQLSIILALAVVIIGYIVIGMAIDKPDKMIAGRPAITGSVFPIFDIINFTIAYSLAILNRGNAAAHKRFMLLAAILMIDPAMARLVLAMGLPGPLILVFELALYAALIVYDVMRLRRPHWASLVGLGLYLVAFAVKLNVENLAWWPDFVRAIF